METVRSKKLVSKDFVFSSLNSSETEIELCDFYGSVLKRLFVKSGLHFSSIRPSLVNTYKNPDVEELVAISFNAKCDRLAYVFAYGAIHSVIMYDHFSNLLKSNHSMLQKCVSMKTIRLCILGGGSALEVTSFIKLFSNILMCHSNMDRETLHIFVTIIDKCIGWKEDAELIVEAAEEYLCDSSSDIQIHYSYIAGDLTKRHKREEMRKAVKEADFVTMVDFLSCMNYLCYSNFKSKIPKMIRQIIEWMSFKACLFFLDTAGGDLFCRMGKFINQHKLTERIYGPCLRKKHVLSMDSKQKLSDTLTPIFRNLKCISQCKISCSAWLKERTVAKVNGLHCDAENVPSELLNDSPLCKLKKKNPKAKKRKDLQSTIKYRQRVLQYILKSDKAVVIRKKKAVIQTKVERNQVNKRYQLRLYDFLTPYQVIMLNIPSYKSSETEIEMCDFYGLVLKRLFEKSGLHFSKIRSSLVNMRGYKNPDVEELVAISFNENCDRLVYVFAYGVIHSVIMYDRFSNLLKSNQSMMQKIVSMNEIRLCILGGGPALEVASFIKLFSNILTCHSNMDREPFHVYVTIIDICIGWKEDAELIVEAIRICLCNSSNIQIHFRFIEADLTREFDEKIRKAIKNSHIVTMVKFLSDVRDTRCSIRQIPDMIGRIIECMRFKACLFFLDTAGGDVFPKVYKLINQHELTAIIYGPCLHNEHILSMDSIQKLSEILRRIFRNLKCTSRCKISCSAWLKVRTATEVDGLYCKNVPLELGELKKKNSKAKKKKDLQSIINSESNSAKKTVIQTEIRRKTKKERKRLNDPFIATVKTPIK